MTENGQPFYHRLECKRCGELSGRDSHSKRMFRKRHTAYDRCKHKYKTCFSMSDGLKCFKCDCVLDTSNFVKVSIQQYRGKIDSFPCCVSCRDVMFGVREEQKG